MSIPQNNTTQRIDLQNSLVVNSFYLFLINLLNKISNVVTFIVLARTTNNVQAGIFTIAITFLLIFTAMTSGLDDLLIRQIARYRSRSGEYFNSYITLRIPLALTLYLIMVILVTLVFNYTSSTLNAIMLIGLCLIPDNLSFLGQALLAGHERFIPSLVSMIVNSGIKITCSILSISFGLGIYGIAAAWISGSTAGCAIVLISAFNLLRDHQFKIQFDKSFWIEQIRMIIPFLIIGILVTIEYQVDVIILSATKDPAEVALLSAMTTILFAFTLFSQAIRVAIFPTKERVRNWSSDNLSALYNLIIQVMLLLSIPIAVGLILLANPLIEFIFGSGFERSVTPLQIVAFTLVLFFLNVPNVRLLLVYNSESYIMSMLGGSVLINIIINVLLDTKYGVLGVALARVISSLFFFTFIYIAASKIIKKQMKFSIVIRPAFSSIIMLLVLMPIRNQSLFIVVPVGILVYFITLSLLKGLPQRESMRSLITM